MAVPARVIDAHVHQWSITEHDDWYPVLKGFAEQAGAPQVYADFLPGDYRATAGDLPVESFVHVSATTAPRAYLDETRWVDALADRNDLDLVMVGSVDPTLDEAGIVADLDTQAGYSRFRGIRVLSGLEPESDAAATILSWLERREYVFDLVTGPTTMTRWLGVLSKYPQLSVALEHTGWPGSVDDDGFAAWRDAIHACATQPGIVCKVSGLGMATADLSVDVLRPWVQTAIDVFGWDRVMFGSNMPMEKMAGTYRQWIDTLAVLLAESSDSEQRRFYAENAAQVYGVSHGR